MAKKINKIYTYRELQSIIIDKSNEIQSLNDEIKSLGEQLKEKDEIISDIQKSF